jgi:hypothetical protein
VVRLGEVEGVERFDPRLDVRVDLVESRLDRRALLAGLVEED